MALVPTAGHVIITPYLASQVRADAVKKRSGLLIAPPTNHKDGGYEGIPNQGYVVALPDGYDGTLQLGDRVVFSENQPKGFKDPDDEKRPLFALQLDQILATIPGEV